MMLGREKAWRVDVWCPEGVTGVGLLQESSDFKDGFRITHGLLWPQEAEGGKAELFRKYRTYHKTSS